MPRSSTPRPSAGRPQPRRAESASPYAGRPESFWSASLTPFGPGTTMKPFLGGPAGCLHQMDGPLPFETDAALLGAMPDVGLFPVVGLGSSAGGVEALHAVVTALPR